MQWRGWAREQTSANICNAMLNGGPSAACIELRGPAHPEPFDPKTVRPRTQNESIGMEQGKPRIGQQSSQINGGVINFLGPAQNMR